MSPGGAGFDKYAAKPARITSVRALAPAYAVTAMAGVGAVPLILSCARIRRSSENPFDVKNDSKFKHWRDKVPEI